MDTNLPVLTSNYYQSEDKTTTIKSILRCKTGKHSYLQGEITRRIPDGAEGDTLQV